MSWKPDEVADLDTSVYADGPDGLDALLDGLLPAAPSTALALPEQRPADDEPHDADPAWWQELVNAALGDTPVAEPVDAPLEGVVIPAPEVADAAPGARAAEPPLTIQGEAFRAAPAPAEPVFASTPVDMTKPQPAPAPAAPPVPPMPPKPPTVGTSTDGEPVPVWVVGPDPLPVIEVGGGKGGGRGGRGQQEPPAPTAPEEPEERRRSLTEIWDTPRGARVKVSLRQAAYWGSAVGAAWFLRMPQFCRDLYVWGHADPAGVAVLAIEAAVGVGTWFALPYAATVLPAVVLKARALVALLAASPAWYLRPQLAAAMAPWGIWPSTVAPLAVALLVNVGCWWLARRYRH
ncbi:hypothetical protein ACFWIQ_36265, partial [Kitasatospora sp. NPDC127059]